MTAIACPICGAEHGLGASQCRKPVVGRTLPGGLRIREKLGETPVCKHYRAEYPNGLEVSVLILGSSGELPFRPPGLQPAKIQHPNIAAVHDLNETEDGLVYAVAERLTGSFLSLTVSRGALPLQEALDLCLQAAAGLQAAHGLGWIHGSLSPHTILLTPTSGGRPLVKLIGFAHQFRLRQSEAESSIERGVYASPERITGLPPDERSDVFSLGAVLHHLLTGAPPKPGSRGARVPKAVRNVLHQALAPLPAQRFQTIAEFAAALSPLLTDVPRTDPPRITIPDVYTAEAAPSKEDQSFPLLAPAAARPARNRRLAFGAAAVLVAAVAGLWTWDTQRPSGAESGDARSQELGSIVAVDPDSSSTIAPLNSDSERVVLDRHDSAAAQVPADSVLRTPSAVASHDSAPAVAESLLVDVQSVDSTIQVDLRYATANNFTGAPLPGYESGLALLHREVAAALGRVQARLRGRGLGLEVFDAYRPVEATRAMFDWAQLTGRRQLLRTGFIGRRSQHNLGVAVDVTLVDLKTGAEIPNPEVLTRTMKSEGFSTLHQASYHFVYELEGAMPLDRVTQ